MKAWFGRTKRRLGYYDARARFREPRFRRALRPTDVFLLGHPKSGNTWLAYMLALLLFPDREDEITLLNVGDFVPVVHGRDAGIAEYSRLPDPRVFRNELPLYRRSYPRVLYIVRDPRAVLVSFWHMYRVMFGDASVPVGSFVDQYMTGTGCFTVWQKHLVRWDRQVGERAKEAAAGAPMAIVRYEDLVQDRASQLARIASFLDLDVDAARLDHVAARGAFDVMQGLEERHGAEAYEGRARGKGRFVRRGRVDGWKDELDPVVSERIEQTFENEMRTMGYL